MLFNCNDGWKNAPQGYVMRTHELCWKNKLAKQFYKYVFPSTEFSLRTVVAQYSEGALVSCIQHVELDLSDAIPLCMCNKLYCKVPSIHNNWISVVVLQLVNQATCFGRFIRPSSGLQNNTGLMMAGKKCPKHDAWLTSCKTTIDIQLLCIDGTLQ